MKMNLNKPYGTVSGHQRALYEQDGVLFDGGGNSLSEDVVKEIKKENEITADVLAEAEGFLRETLSGGPMSENKVFKASEEASQDWDAVKTVAANIGVRFYNQGPAKMWKLVDTN